MTETTDNIGEIFSAAAKPRVSTRRSRVSTRRRRPDDLAGRWSRPLAWVTIALLVGPHMPAWAWMWLLAVAVFAACKWATWWPYRFDARATAAVMPASSSRTPAWTPRVFISARPQSRPRTTEWIITLAKALVGAAMIWIVTAHDLPRKRSSSPAGPP